MVYHMYGAKGNAGGVGTRSNSSSTQVNGGVSGSTSGQYDGIAIRSDDFLTEIPQGDAYQNCTTQLKSWESIPGVVYSGTAPSPNSDRAVFSSKSPSYGFLAFTVPTGYRVSIKATITAKNARAPYNLRTYNISRNAVLGGGDYVGVGSQTGSADMSIVKNQREYVDSAVLKDLLAKYSEVLVGIQINYVQKCDGPGDSDNSDDSDCENGDCGGSGDAPPMTFEQKYFLIGLFVIGLAYYRITN